MGESRTLLEKKYPGAFGMYQFDGYTYTKCGIKLEDSFFSGEEQQAINDYLVIITEFTGEEVELTLNTFAMAEFSCGGYLPNN